MHNMRTKLLLVAAAGWAVIALAIIGVSLLLISPEHRSPFFWERILWAQFLAALVLFSNAFLISKAPPSVGGILPAFRLVVTAYAFLSLAWMLFNAFLPNADFISRFHLAGQIVLMAVAIAVCILLNISRVAAAHGTEPIPEGTCPPNELASLLKAEEFRIQQGSKAKEYGQLVAVLKSLREQIQYSLPHVGEIGRREEYRQFSEAVRNACQKVDASIREPALVENRIANLRQEFSDLAMKVESIAESLKRR